MSAGAPRLLVISPNWIGDAVMAQPLLQLLRRQHPDSPIDVLAPGWVAPVWRAMQEVDTVIEAPFRHGALQLRERWAFARQLRKRAYGAAYVLPNTLKFALIPWLAGIPKRVGYRGEMRYGLLNVVHRDERKPKRPMVSFYAALASAPVAVAPPPGALPRPALSASAAQQAYALEQAGLDASRPLLVFAPGAEFGSAKRWPAVHFAELANTVLEKLPDMQIALLGSGKDRPVCDEIVALAPAVHNLAGSTSLDQAIALIAASRAVVSNDSGLLHIASALNRAIVALYGPTDPAHAPPFSDVAQSLWLHLECSPCRKRECPLGHHNCMRQMSADMVWQPLQAMLRNPPAS
ncbi:lipopolysaccharide heptosyltransferase II [Noviherbaspirillum suwonense]|uniref:lipopolysaccharide heptosyltransferase II n=1 Tax=Noviherbaspirillum suwonense TaxID=1224511 RepID=A0ABY1Q6V3_9BURK|nr:lipopolysaccharide heptosyltransferase II [Noviherbaspirillum suwonense]SMP59218.1 heptosyltransferase-2 [Noviherbaspirillum suwonense]